MNILVVGSVIKDVYLNLDNRTESFETDKHGIKWLNLSFDASKHHFFHQESSFGGAAVTLEVLTKLGLPATISGSDLKYTPDDGFTSSYPTNSHRYILIADEDPSYFAPSNRPTTPFDTPSDFYDYIYIDRSASLNQATAQKIQSYLDFSKNTKLVIYLKNPADPIKNQLAAIANLVFFENNRGISANHQALSSLNIQPENLIQISESQLTYLDITEPLSINRVDLFTHLSAFSIIAATILGSFILGKSVEESLRLARINLEHSKLNSSLTLEELQARSAQIDKSHHQDLELIAANLVLEPKGILAADESGGSIHKKFEQLNIPDTYDDRRDYRNIFFTAQNLENHVNGVILFDETARQTADNGQNFVDYLAAKHIIPGIKVDQGLEKFENSDETYTKGLDNLKARLQEYHQMGLRFTKWRAAFNLTLDDNHHILTPTDHAIAENCRILAEYAKACQEADLVPIVEPELVYDGNYTIEDSAQVTGKILDQLFDSLNQSKVNLRACILKVNMIMAGKQSEAKSTPTEVGKRTAAVLKNHIPEHLAGVVFLSGGQTPEEATDNLAAILQNGPFPWPVTFSFARALQDPALYAWAGDNNNAEKARQAFLDRLIANTNALKSA